MSLTRDYSPTFINSSFINSSYGKISKNKNKKPNQKMGVDLNTHF